MDTKKKIILKPKARGFHLIDSELLNQLPELKKFRLGLAHFFIQHTSASLSINENADPSVRSDLEKHLRKVAPDDAPHYSHRDEGPDDMAAHIKCALLGPELTIPISQGKLLLGVWQGIYLGEHREMGGERRIIVTLNGEAD